MSEYRRKLRSSTRNTTEPVEEVQVETQPVQVKNEDIYDDDLLYREDPESPKTPPTQSIGPYFPPSPYGRKRHQAHGDRFIPTRERNLARDFQMMETPHSTRRNNDTNFADTPESNGESRRFKAFFHAEMLDDPTAADEFVSPDSPSRTQRRVLNYTTSSSNLSGNITPSTSTNTPNPSTPSSSNTTNSSINIVQAVSNLSPNIFSSFHARSAEYRTRIHSPESHDALLSSSAPPVLSPSPTHYELTTTTTLDSPNSSRFQTLPIGEAGRRILTTSDRFSRQINTTPIKILDAPELQDDFYLNLVDWGSNDSLAVGLGTCVYLWNANTSKVTKLIDLVTDKITSVNWSTVGTNLLAVGTNSGKAMLFNADTQQRLRAWTNHTSRIGAMAWRSNILSSGGRDHAIYHHDVRSSEAYFQKLEGHSQEICGLKWNTEGTMLASGGNDNNLLIWDSHENVISHRFTQHIAAVKAIAWSPHKRGVLVSGGGTADKTIKFWNTISGQMTSTHDTGSQVCNITWSKKTNDIVSSHGYTNNNVGSSNSVIIWKADKMQKLAALTGHGCRVLYMSMSNDGSTVVTGAGDETLRFWDVFSQVETTRVDLEDRRSCLR